MPMRMTAVLETSLPILDGLSATRRLTPFPGGSSPSNTTISGGGVGKLARHSVADEVARRRLRRRGHV